MTTSGEPFPFPLQRLFAEQVGALAVPVNELFAQLGEIIESSVVFQRTPNQSSIANINGYKKMHLSFVMSRDVHIYIIVVLFVFVMPLKPVIAWLVKVVAQRWRAPL